MELNQYLKDTIDEIKEKLFQDLEKREFIATIIERKNAVIVLVGKIVWRG